MTPDEIDNAIQRIAGGKLIPVDRPTSETPAATRPTLANALRELDQAITDEVGIAQDREFLRRRVAQIFAASLSETPAPPKLFDHSKEKRPVWVPGFGPCICKDCAPPATPSLPEGSAAERIAAQLERESNGNTEPDKIREILRNSPTAAAIYNVMRHEYEERVRSLTERAEAAEAEITRLRSV